MLEIILSYIRSTLLQNDNNIHRFVRNKQMLLAALRAMSSSLSNELKFPGAFYKDTAYAPYFLEWRVVVEKGGGGRCYR